MTVMEHRPTDINLLLRDGVIRPEVVDRVAHTGGHGRAQRAPRHKGLGAGERPAPVRWGHPEQDADVRSALGTSVDTDAGLDRALRSLVALSSKAIDGAASCGVTVQVADRVFTAVHSDARTLRVDADQYEIGSGPCLHAARTGDVVRVDRVEAEKRWPRFADVAREENIRSFLAVPLATERVRFGSLNLYGEASSAFTDADVDTAVGLTRCWRRSSVTTTGSAPSAPRCRGCGTHSNTAGRSSRPRAS